jgi:hypothetical protein
VKVVLCRSVYEEFEEINSSFKSEVVKKQLSRERFFLVCRKIIIIRSLRRESFFIE